MFPTAKYGRACSALLQTSIIDRADIIDPDPATWDDLALVHTSAYLQAVREGGLTSAELARLELPWSPAMVEGFRLVTGGTVQAARRALGDGVAVQLGGGFHHAFPDHGEGFCVFNDSAVAIQALRRDGLIRRAAVLDCDVHHGNGTACIFASDPAVVTCSLHQQNNYPPIKPTSSLDIGLADGTRDREYLDRLQDGLACVMATKPDVMVYPRWSRPVRGRISSVACRSRVTVSGAAIARCSNRATTRAYPSWFCSLAVMRDASTIRSRFTWPRSRRRCG